MTNLRVKITSINFKEGFDRLARVSFSIYESESTFIGGYMTIMVPDSFDKLENQIADIFLAKVNALQLKQ